MISDLVLGFLYGSLIAVSVILLATIIVAGTNALTNLGRRRKFLAQEVERTRPNNLAALVEGLEDNSPGLTYCQQCSQLVPITAMGWQYDFFLCGQCQGHLAHHIQEMGNPPEDGRPVIG